MNNIIVINKFQPPLFKLNNQNRNFSNDVINYSSLNRSSTTPTNCKLIVLGDVGVGKTCLIKRFCNNTFERDYKATIGVDFEVELLSILGCRYILNIWDTAGQEKFKAIAQPYYRQANIIFLVYDMSAIDSMSHCSDWLSEASPFAADNASVFVIGTKADLISDATREQIEAEAIKLSGSLSAECWSTSAYTGENVRELFVRASCKAYETSVLRIIAQSSQNTVKVGSVLTSKTMSSTVDLTNSDLAERSSRSTCCSR